MSWRTRAGELRGDCWVCNGVGHVTKHGCGKSVKCGECHGTGWLVSDEEMPVEIGALFS